MVPEPVPASVRWFRIFSFVEASSFLLLLLVAMPLKYAFGIPVAVSIVGALHGAIFVGYLVWLPFVAVTLRWGVGSVVGSVVAAILPCGPFVFDRLVLSRKGA